MLLVRLPVVPWIVSFTVSVWVSPSPSLTVRVNSIQLLSLRVDLSVMCFFFMTVKVAWDWVALVKKLAPTVTSSFSEAALIAHW